MTLPAHLISTDFDGTIFAEFENPPVPTALQDLLGQLQQQGVTWVINTGRDMSALMESIGRGHLHVRPDYLVLVEREIYRHQDTRYVPVDPWNQRCRDDHATLFQRVRPDLPDLVRWINSRFEATLYEDSYSPLCMIAANADDADIMVEHVESYCRTVPDLTVVRNDVYARFSHAGYSKGTALSEIQRLLELTPAETIAAGDHYNDLPMLTRERAHHLIAPANAIEIVRCQVADQGGHLCRAPSGYGVLEGLSRLYTPA